MDGPILSVSGVKEEGGGGERYVRLPAPPHIIDRSETRLRVLAHGKGGDVYDIYNPIADK